MNTEKQCPICGVSFTVGRLTRKQKFCGVSCRIENQRRFFSEKQCPVCKKTFPVSGRMKKQKFCGQPCYFEHQKTITGEKNWNTGRKRSQEFCKRMSALQLENKRLGSKASGWKGGRFFDKRHGYVFLHRSLLSEEENVWFKSHNHSYVPEHRVVVARRVGRALSISEHVHHINGIKNDNRPENLVLQDHGKHTHEHAMMWRRLHLLEEENLRLRKRLEKYEKQIPLAI